MHYTARRFDRVLAPIHWFIWRDERRRVQKLIRFGATETDGGRDLLRAAEVTRDPLLRRLYLLHATDEQRHGMLFRRRAMALLARHPERSRGTRGPGWSLDFARDGHGLDDLEVEREPDDTMLAFLHVAEQSAASRFTVYRDIMQFDPDTRRVFDDILHDEMFHMNYTAVQLVRVAPQHHRSRLWRARLSRLWKAYLRLASAIAGAIGGVILTVQYFVLLPPFAWLAKRAARRDIAGWTAVPEPRHDSLRSQY